MKKELKDYLHLYLGVDGKDHNGLPIKLTAINLSKILSGAIGFAPILRRLSDMTEEEMTNLLLLLIFDEIEDKPSADDHSIEMFYNDGGNMVDDDVAVGCNYSCICYEGQIGIRKDGSIHLFDESGEKEALYNMPKLYAYLLSKHFDLFGLVESGLALDATLIATPTQLGGRTDTGTSPTK